MKSGTDRVFKLLPLVVSGLLSACMPAPLGKYYKPVYPDPSTTYTGDSCGGKAGAPASLTTVLADSVTLSINAWRTYGEQKRIDRPLHISIQIPKNTRVHFLSDEIRLSTSPLDAGQIIDAQVTVSDAVMIPSDSVVNMHEVAPTPFPLDGAMQVATSFVAHTTLNFSWKDDFVPSSLSMDIPPIILSDEVPKPLQPIKLYASAKKRPETYPGQYKSSTSLLYTTKDSELALAQKYARCKEETPDLKCNQILLYEDGSFRLFQQGFGYSGRMYVFDVEKHSPFSGELKIEYKAPVNWKFASNKVRVTDLSSKAERVYSFDEFALYFRYEIPLNTPIRGVNDAPYSKTTNITINSSLGAEELSKYYLKLPRVLINGKPYQIKPVEFEKRLFDFGIEPFNC